MHSSISARQKSLEWRKEVKNIMSWIKNIKILELFSLIFKLLTLYQRSSQLKMLRGKKKVKIN